MAKKRQLEKQLDSLEEDKVKTLIRNMSRMLDRLDLFIGGMAQMKPEKIDLAELLKSNERVIELLRMIHEKDSQINVYAETEDNQKTGEVPKLQTDNRIFKRIRSRRSWTDSTQGSTLTGIVDGSNAEFTLRRIPTRGTEKIYFGCSRFTRTEDYTIVGRTITFNTAPPSGTVITIDYDA